MDLFLQFLKVFFSNSSIFLIIQILILIIFLYAIIGDKKKELEKFAPKNQKLNELVLAYSIISVSVIQAVSSLDVLSDFKLSIIIANLVAVFYLSFMSPWFRRIIERVFLRIGRGTIKL